ncbi:MAG TPA: glycosyltransferase family 4 protein [Acetobacteraceae bacterium]|nr:glycosyltransferase family 4 protein [Acetobacteraceae bacterium]
MESIRLLTFSTLYPNDVRPNHGIFVENRLRHLIASQHARSIVVAPVPWFPSRSPWFGDWARDTNVAPVELRHGITVHHPRYPVIPKIGMSMAPYLLFRATLPMLRHLLASGQRIDVIDAHYLYPDGVAAVWLGRALGLPTVVTARGTDVNLIPQYALPRALIRRAIAGAAALIAVSAALKSELVALGAPDEKVTVLRNGVDVALFRPMDRSSARAALGLTRPTLVSVGHLIERKGHHRIIEAMTRLPEFALLIVGEGPQRDSLATLINRLGLADRVRLLGARPHAELPSLYGAADILVLASSREGWANVLLEAMACGTPVVASNIWGNPEVVRDAAAGLIADENTPAGIVAAVRRLFAHLPERAATRAYAEQFSWDATTDGQLALFRSLRTLGRPASMSRSA